MVGLDRFIPHVPGFLLVLFRITGIFVFAPMFAGAVIPMRVKVMLALVLAFCVYPIVHAPAPVTLELGSLAPAVGSEVLVGLVIGFGASLPLVAMQLAGKVMGQQLGLDIGTVFNPDFNEQVQVMSQMLSLVALTVFLLLDGHHAMLAALVNSFDAVPLGVYMPGGATLDLLVGLLTAMFELAIRVAAPLLCLVFLETVAMGLVARTVPQLNILSLGFPLRIVLGLFLMIGMVSLMFDSVGETIGQVMGALLRTFTVHP